MTVFFLPYLAVSFALSFTSILATSLVISAVFWLSGAFSAFSPSFFAYRKDLKPKYWSFANLIVTVTISIVTIFILFRAIPVSSFTTLGSLFGTSFFGTAVIARVVSWCTTSTATASSAPPTTIATTTTCPRRSLGLTWRASFAFVVFQI